MSKASSLTCLPSSSPSPPSPCFSLTPASRNGHFVKFLSAAFYALSSFLIIVVNKTVLTNYRASHLNITFLPQMAFTIIILYLAKICKAVTFQDFDRNLPRKIFPLPLLYVGNHVTGLGGTKKLSLPMFTVLRKFSILLTMIMESKILRKAFSPQLVFSVLAILFGAVIAASSDLAFDAEGYAFVLLNDVFTAASGVYTKKKLGVEGLGKYGVLFYNAFIIIIPTILASAFTGDLEKAVAFEGWLSLSFVLYFLMSCVMGFILMYSIILCSYYNSALTTTVIGAIKNVAVAYIGMFIGGDYLFSWPNFVGLNICISGGLLYSYLTFNTRKSPSSRAVNQEETKLGAPVVGDDLARAKAEIQ
uniref:Sugar phosphate transporter domain-containing protein n=1 Tax=Electrophorus electricus TaxID=8005 RepID=A0A4W4F6K1_ELEEL